MEPAIENTAHAAQYLEDLERDAARYRWLKYEAIRTEGPVPYCVIGTCPADAYPAEGDELDAAIDAAMKEQA